MLRKGGSLEKKDLSNLIIIYEVYLILYIAVAMSAEDWETKYREICEKFVEEQKKTEVLKDRLESK